MKIGYGIKGISSTKFAEVRDIKQFFINYYKEFGEIPAYVFIIGDDGIAVDYNA